jgi:hypothetical protein
MQASDCPHGYYRRREKQERDMAARAKDPAARQIHLALAERYRNLLNGQNLLNGEIPSP